MVAVTVAPLMYLITRPHASESVSIRDIEAIPPERAYEHLIQEAARTYDLDAALIRAVMRVESSFNPLVVSPARRIGSHAADAVSGGEDGRERSVRSP